MNARNKVALITGSSRGIGRAVALALAERGANIAVNYVKEKEEAQSVAKMVGSETSVVVVQADVSNSGDVDHMVKAVVTKFGRLDIVVNNAGIRPISTSILDIKEQEWNMIVDVNLKGAFNVCKAAVPHMIRQRAGRIVNISSIVGRMGSEMGVAYAASKAGLIGLSMALATELAPYNITVNVVAPGAIDTGWYLDQEKPRIAERAPLGRLGTPQEVARAVIYLIENDYVTGEVVNVDGGRFLRKF